MDGFGKIIDFCLYNLNGKIGKDFEIRVLINMIMKIPNYFLGHHCHCN